MDTARTVGIILGDRIPMGGPDRCWRAERRLALACACVRALSDYGLIPICGRICVCVGVVRRVTRVRSTAERRYEYERCGLPTCGCRAIRLCRCTRGRGLSAILMVFGRKHVCNLRSDSFLVRMLSRYAYIQWCSVTWNHNMFINSLFVLQQ